MAQRLCQVLAVGLLCAFAAWAAEPDIERLMEEGHWKRARSAVEQEASKNPNAPYSKYLLSRLRLADGDLGQAKSFAEQAVKAEPNSAKYAAQLLDVEGSIIEKASFFKQMMMARALKNQMDRAASLDPKATSPRFALLQYYLHAPAIAGGDKAKARAMADEIERIDPVEGCLARIELARFDKNEAAIEPLYVKAVQANPKHYGVRISLANLYFSDKQKKYDIAEKNWQAAQETAPTRIEAYNMLAVWYAKSERWQDLDKVLATAEANVPDNLNPCYQAGRTLLENGKDLARAERYFRKYLTQPPELRSPSLARAHWRLGLVLEKEGRKEEARNELRAALNLDSKMEDVKKDLQRLQ
jgi:tetratricopeptide (TPR) repeat protein